MLSKKDVCVHWAHNSTSHSIPKITRTKNVIIRIMWSLLTLLSVLTCSILIFMSISDYLKYEVVTQIRVIDEIESEFPTITICNKEPFVTEAARQIFNNISNNFEQFILSSTYEENFFSFLTNYIVMTKMKTSSYTDEQLLSLNYNRTQFIFNCQFNFIECDYDTFQWYFDYIYGICYRYNTGYYFNNTLIGSDGTISTISSSSVTYGLRLSLFLGIENNKNNLNFHVVSKGGVVFIGNSSFLPSTQDLISFTAGIETNIDVKRVFTKKLSPPHGHCLQDLSKSNSDYYKHLIKLNRKYRRSDCLIISRQVPVENICNCSSTFYIKYDHSLGYCETFAEIKCAFEVTTHSEKLMKNDFDTCPLECEAFTYDYGVSTLGPINKVNLRNTKNYLISKGLIFSNITDDDLISSLGYVNIYYNRLGYTEINEKPSYTVVSLISNIGGTIGLFLGLSVLSLFEIIELAIMLISHSLKPINKRIKKIKVQPPIDNQL
jgi:hypothetical protein